MSTLDKNLASFEQDTTKPRMRAKFKVTEVTSFVGGQKVSMTPVCAKTFGPNGESEDNDFARYTPSGEIRLHITNPALDGKLKPGQSYYVEFTESPEEA